MSRPMTLAELHNVLTRAEVYNGPFSRNPTKTVKYIYPSIDLRDGKCFAVRFDGYGRSFVLHCANEFREVPESLYERCLEFLNTPEWPKES